jgi:hypothetical protein
MNNYAHTLHANKLKNIFTFILLLSLVFAFVFLSGCKKDEPTASEVTTNKLTSATWKIGSVTVNNTDQTPLFTNMTLKFTDTNYTTTNGGIVWPMSGTWTFVDDTAKEIKRNDDLEITIVEATDASLKLSLTWDTGTFGPGRVSSVVGVHVFSFGK